jgi:hypothetical protein
MVRVFDVNSEEVDNKLEELSQAGVDVDIPVKVLLKFLGFR